MSIFWSNLEDTLQWVSESDSGELLDAYLCNRITDTDKIGYLYNLALFTNKVDFKEYETKSVAVSLLEFKHSIRSISFRILPENVWFHQFFSKSVPRCTAFSRELQIQNESQLVQGSQELIIKCQHLLLKKDFSFYLNELFSGENFTDDVFDNNVERRNSMKDCIANLELSLEE